MTPAPAELPSWIRRMVGSGYLLPVLFCAALLEAIIIPIPLELMLIPLLLLEPRRRWLLASVALAGCLCGALLGYWFGNWLFDSLGQWLLEVLDATDAYDRFVQTLANEGFMAIVVVGVTPVPFQVAMLAAGAADYPLTSFMLAATLARGIRYFGLAVLVQLFGEQAMTLFRRHARPLGLTLLAMALLGYGLNWWLTG
ncbi:YqaA family protein [Oceanisphaera psychrotolerans]|uniref:Alkaline phosphatase n=1 Tax=Oceanisphaera psychrotolerans TaxID=1414654 RepID=A0A1J4QC15_9GAMM|nr:VTT domain-containing protein [Oceanisphaera psychrotolerans]OIN07632.1 alkaline phosphatase [Oceanisphaera psychrotolerans]